MANLLPLYFFCINKYLNCNDYYRIKFNGDKMNKLIFKTLVLICICLSLVIFTNTYNAYSKSECIHIDKIERHWWGYRRYISDEEISRFASKFDSLAAELSILGGISTPISFLNPIAGGIASAVFEISSSYCWLISTYFIKINRGKGIMVDFTKGIVFRIKPL